MSFRNRPTMPLLVLIACALMLVLTGCGAKSAEEPTTPATDTTQAAQEATTPAQGATGAGGETLYTPTYKPNGKETATIKTNKGDIVVELYGNDAPITVGSFIELVQKGFYDKTRFHRYEPGFVIQGGDPQSKGLSADEVNAALQSGNPPLGTGGPGYNIKGEFGDVNPNKHVEGALGLARSQSPDSGGSQFYFTLAATPFLDGNYAVFGKVTKGLDVVKELRAGDEIESVTISGAQ